MTNLTNVLCSQDLLTSVMLEMMPCSLTCLWLIWLILAACVSESRSYLTMAMLGTPSILSSIVKPLKYLKLRANFVRTWHDVAHLCASQMLCSWSVGTDHLYLKCAAWKPCCWHQVFAVTEKHRTPTVSLKCFCSLPFGRKSDLRPNPAEKHGDRGRRPCAQHVTMCLSWDTCWLAWLASTLLTFENMFEPKQRRICLAWCFVLKEHVWL